MNDVFSDVPNITVSSIDFSDWKVTFPTKETAIVTYKYTSKGNFYKGKDISGTSIALGTYVNIGGEWKAAAYAETKAEPQPKK